SDLTDGEWALIEPMIPPAKRGGRRREVNIREVLNAIFYVLSTGCQWQALPKDLPPKSTAHSYFMLWDWDGTLERIHHALYVETREREGREASPTAAIIDSQSVFQHRSGTPVKTGLSAYYCYQIRWKGGVPIGADRDPLPRASLSITLILYPARGRGPASEPYHISAEPIAPCNRSGRFLF